MAVFQSSRSRKSERVFRDVPLKTFKALVTHHPLGIPSSGEAARELAGRSRLALDEEIANVGVHLLLSGHHHRALSGGLADIGGGGIGPRPARGHGDFNANQGRRRQYLQSDPHYQGTDFDPLHGVESGTRILRTPSRVIRLPRTPVGSPNSSAFEEVLGLLSKPLICLRLRSLLLPQCFLDPDRSIKAKMKTAPSRLTRRRNLVRGLGFEPM